MIDQLRQVIDHLQQLEGVTEGEQRALAQRIEALIEEYKDEMKWRELFGDPRSERMLNKLVAEAETEISVGTARPIEELF